MEAKMTRHRHRALTLFELLVVMGLISVLLSLLLRVVGKARAAARSTACLSNIRQLGMAMTLYSAENKGRLMENVSFTPATPDLAWGCNWLGVAEQYQVRGDALLCPSASDPSSRTKGYGSTSLAWNGELNSNGTSVRLKPTTFRVGSYGFNAYLASSRDDSKLKQ